MGVYATFSAGMCSMFRVFFIVALLDPHCDGRVFVVICAVFIFCPGGGGPTILSRQTPFAHPPSEPAALIPRGGVRFPPFSLGGGRAWAPVEEWPGVGRPSVQPAAPMAVPQPPWKPGEGPAHPRRGPRGCTNGWEGWGRGLPRAPPHHQTSRTLAHQKKLPLPHMSG